MKNTDIAKIRYILNSILLIYGGNNHQLGEWTKEALTLLPCETCNGTGKAPSSIPHTCMGQSIPCKICDLSEPCPDCRPEPCETCGGTKQVPTPQSIGFGKQNEILDTCPDCEKKPESMITADYMNCWLVHPNDDEDCNMCPKIIRCRDLRKYWRPKESICKTCEESEVRHPIDLKGVPNHKRNYCYQCGTTVRDQKYCHGCGRKLKWPACPNCQQNNALEENKLVEELTNELSKVIESLENAGKARDRGSFNTKYTVETCLSKVCEFVTQALTLARIIKITLKEELK